MAEKQRDPEDQVPDFMQTLRKQPALMNYSVARWKKYVRDMRVYADSIQMTDKQQVHVLMTQIDGDYVPELAEMCAPEKPRQKKFDELIKIIDKLVALNNGIPPEEEKSENSLKKALTNAYERARNKVKLMKNVFKRNAAACCLDNIEAKKSNHSAGESHHFKSTLLIMDPYAETSNQFTEGYEYGDHLLVMFKGTDTKFYFAVDAATNKSFITKQCYLQYFNKIHRESRLDEITGHKQEYVRVIIEWCRFCVSVDLEIIDGPERAVLGVLGRDWLEDQVYTEFLQVFSASAAVRQCTHKIKINLKDTTPVFREPYVLPPKLQDCVEKELTKLESQGTIYRVENSKYATPIIPFVKSNEDVLICAEYNNTVNPKIQEPKYRLPRVALVCAALHEGQHFTRLDLSDVYQHMQLEKESQPLTSISTHLGVFAYRQVPFGLKGTLGHVQTIVGEVLKNFKFAMVLDDIWVTGKHWGEHLQNLRAVLVKLKEIGIVINWAKSDFFGDSLRYVGYGMNKRGMYVDQKRLKAITDAPNPTSASDLRSFLGLVNFYRKFCLDCYCILKPLYALLDAEGEWHWTTECDTAYSKIKCVLASFLVSAVFVDDLPLVLAVASGPRGVGAVLSHIDSTGSERPIACASRTLSDTECAQSQLDKEVMAVAFGVEMHRQYLYGNKFVVRSDQRDLRRVFVEGVRAHETSELGSGLQWNLARVADFDFKVEYAPTDQNESAVALSRLPLSPTFKCLSDQMPSLRKEQKEAEPDETREAQEPREADEADANPCFRCY